MKTSARSPQPWSAAVVVGATGPWLEPEFLPPVSASAKSSVTASAAGLASAASGAPWAFDAVVFDMDGVVTDTAAVHAAAWQRMFDDYLRRRKREHGEPFRAFTSTDYRAYVDGRPRYQGVRAFLESRGLRLAAGTPGDAPELETICGLGNRKNAWFNEIVGRDGVRVYASTLALIRELRAAGRKVGLATSSRNAALVLAQTAAAPLFGTIVDGLVAERLHLAGKPAPDIFVTAAADLGAAPARTVVVEDAVAGVQAGVAGGFALVIGVAREHDAGDLRAAGADVVVRDLAEIGAGEINQKVRLKGAET